MAKVIIYLQDSGYIATVFPAAEILDRYSVEQVARKDVPAGKPYKILDETELPENDLFFDAWTVAEEYLTDGVGDEYMMFDDDPNHPDNLAV